MIRPSGAAGALLIVIGLLIGLSSVVWGAEVITGEQPGYPGTLIGPVFGLVLAALFFVAAMRPGISVYDDRLVIVASRSKSLLRYPTRTIWYRDIAGFSTGLMGEVYVPGTPARVPESIGGMTDVLYLTMVNGTTEAIDVENYSDGRVARLLWELMVCTNIWPDGRVRPQQHSDAAWLRGLKAAGALVGSVVVIFVVPIAAIWLEAWLVPSHPPRYQSGWRTGYMLAGIFAGFPLVAMIAARSRERQLSSGMDLQRGHIFYHRMTVIAGAAAVVLYVLAVLLFWKATTV